jgi:hypothetical protein
MKEPIFCYNATYFNKKMEPAALLGVEKRENQHVFLRAFQIFRELEAWKESAKELILIFLLCGLLKFFFRDG